MTLNLLQTPWGMIEAEVKIQGIDLGETHTVVTEEAAAALRSLAEIEAMNRAQAGATYRLYEGVRAAVSRMIAPRLEAAVTFTYSTERGFAEMNADGGLIVQAYPKLVINGYDVRHWIDIHEERTAVHRFRSRPNGKVRVTIGMFGDSGRKSYPQRADGTHSYDKIADQLVGIVEQQAAKDRMERTRRANAASVNIVALQAELGVSEYSAAFRVAASADRAAPVFVKVAIGRAMTVEQVRALHAALVAAGVSAESMKY